MWIHKSLGERFGHVVQSIRYDRQFSINRQMIYLTSVYYHKMLIVVITIQLRDRPLTCVYLNLLLQSSYVIMLIETNIFISRIEKLKVVVGESFVTIMAFGVLFGMGNFLNQSEQKTLLGES